MKDANGFSTWAPIEHDGSLEPRPEISDVLHPTITQYESESSTNLADAIDRYHNKEA
jgi:hypothetical protein